MKFINETRKHFEFEMDKPIDIHIDGVYSDGDILKFSKDGTAQVFKNGENRIPGNEGPFYFFDVIWL